MSVLDEIAAERRRQDGKWGGPAHDDAHSTAEFVQFIEDYAGWARQMASMNSPDKARRRLIQVAALAVAAVESMDRRSANNGSQSLACSYTGPLVPNEFGKLACPECGVIPRAADNGSAG